MATIIFGGKSIRQISGVLVFIVFLRLVGVFLYAFYYYSKSPIFTTI